MSDNVLIYAGIDEAGYGPMLGPLCVAATAFVVRDLNPASANMCDLWKRLNKTVCRKRTDKRRRIAVDDSKKLKLPNDGEKIHPLKYLERGVLSFLMAAGGRETARLGDDDLFQTLGVDCPGAEWYRTTTALPVAQTDDELHIAASRLRRALQAADIECGLMRCEAIDAESFNRQVELMGNKSSVNFCAVMRHVEAIRKKWPQDAPHIVVDRQGGRTHYLNDLMLSYPEARIQILEESEVLSQYRVHHEDRGELQISFAVEAESAHLPVALASMAAKYVRELFMIRLNRYFRSLMPELKATAGYTEDARRYLNEIDTVLSRSGIDRKSLVRAV